jgi:hypothetical protein
MDPVAGVISSADGMEYAKRQARFEFRHFLRSDVALLRIEQLPGLQFCRSAKNYLDRVKDTGFRGALIFRSK